MQDNNHKLNNPNNSENSNTLDILALIGNDRFFKNLKIINKLNINGTGELIEVARNQLLENKELFIKNHPSNEEIIFKTYHSLPPYLVQKKENMHAFLILFLDCLKEGNSFKTSYIKSLSEIPLDFLDDFCQTILSTDNLVNTLQKFRDYFSICYAFSKNEISEILIFKEENRNTQFTDLNIEILKFINSKIQPSKRNHLKEFLNIDFWEIYKELPNIPVFKNKTIFYKTTIFNLSEKVVETYYKLHEFNEHKFSLNQLNELNDIGTVKYDLYNLKKYIQSDKFQKDRNVKTGNDGKKSIFGDIFKDNDYQKAFKSFVDELTDESQTLYSWKKI